MFTNKAVELIRKTCIFTATLLVAVLVFIAGVFETPVQAAKKKSKIKETPLSSVDRIALKVKDFEKYYKLKTGDTSSEDENQTETKDDKESKGNTEARPGNDPETVKDSDSETSPDSGSENDTGADEDADSEKTAEDGNTEDTGSKDIKWNDNYTEAELRLMAGIIYCEAGSMSEPARIAVANVIINRVNSKTDWKHVSTIRDVIYDEKWGVQFSPIKGNPSLLDQAMDIYDNLEDYKGNWRYDQMKNCIDSAKKAFCGEKAIPDSYMYFNGSIESSKKKCESKGRNYTVIDHHIYFE